jgi:hypothetical protein
MRSGPVKDGLCLGSQSRLAEPSIDPAAVTIVDLGNKRCRSGYQVSGSGLETSTAAAASTPARTSDSTCRTAAKRLRWRPYASQLDMYAR